MEKRGLKIITSFVLVILLLGINHALAYTLYDDWEEYPEKGGPIAIRNQMPLYLFYLQLVPDKAGVIERNKFKIDADYTVSNITVSAFTPASSLYDIQIDMEVSRVTLDFRYGLYDNLEIGLEVPYLSLSRGYLDNFIESVEDGIGARTPRSRENQGSYKFDFSFQYNNVFIVQEKHSRDGIGDIVLNLKYQMLRETMWLLPNISLRTAVKFPSGDKDKLLGSGEVDYGLGILIDKGFFDRFFIYLGANAVKIKRPSVFSVLSIKEYIYSGLVGMEFFPTKRFSIVTQVTANTTPYPHSDTNPLDNDAFELGLGFNYTWKEKTNVSWHFAVTENITAASSPDVSFHSGIRWKF